MNTTLRASILAALIAALPTVAGAAGLGRLTVLSALGQPLKAEVELNASADELSTLTAKLASPEAFKQAGIEFGPALSGLKISVDRKGASQGVVRIASDRPINEPFLDLLLELNWAGGRLVREYTFLLDPADATPAKPVPAPVALPEAKPPVATPSAPKTEAEPKLSIPEEPAPAAQTKSTVAAASKGKKGKAVREVEPKSDAKPEGTASSAGTYTVKSGDTLAGIAHRNMAEGVSLDQMLVALLKGNEDAFVGKNINRLKTGKILNLPDQTAAQSVSAAEARKIVRAQAADFNSYRTKVASAAAGAAPAKEDVGQQEAKGKITPKVEDKAPKAADQDRVQVSRTQPAAGKAKGAEGADKGRMALEEEVAAKDKALKEANSRVAELERNVQELNKLLELKNQSLAELQKQAQGGKSPADAAKKVEPEAKPVVPAPVVAEKPAGAAGDAKPPVEAAKPEVKPDAVKPDAPPKPETPKPPVKKPVPLPEPEVEEPGIVEQLMENPVALAGGGGILALLLGYFGLRARQKRKAEADAVAEPTISGNTTTGTPALDSVFGAAGGSIADSSGSSIQTDFSQASIAAAENDEGVDPVAEADVYIAYGRDAQAEEILLEALKTEPSRHAIHLKLLEIYSQRNSPKQFETIASELYNQTGGVGADWEKAAAMGQRLDPTNPLYGGDGQEGSGLGGVATAAVTGAAAWAGGQAQAAKDAVTDFLSPAASEPAVPKVDIDLGLEMPESKPAVSSLSVMDTAAGGGKTEPKMSLDFDLGETVTESGKGPMADLSFDLAEPAATPAAKPQVDLSSIDLDLGDAAAASAPSQVPALDSAAFGEVATKLELAKAYEEMGDKEGARELLGEVLQEGNPDQQAQAKAMLGKLG